MPQRNGLAEVKIVFWTSTEYSGFMAGLIRELQDLGHSAEQRYQIPEATYRASKSTSERFLLRIRQYLIYPIQLSAVLFLQRLAGFFYKGSGLEGEICIVSTNTFYAPLIATYLHPRTVHLVYDLFPEAMIHAGKWREGSPKVKLSSGGSLGKQYSVPTSMFISANDSSNTPNPFTAAQVTVPSSPSAQINRSSIIHRSPTRR